MLGKYLIINSGSSSLKFSLYEMPETNLIAKGIIERIGQDSEYSINFDGKKIKKRFGIKNHNQAINVMFSELLSNELISRIEEIKGVGHRILHGGEIYSSPVLIDENVIKDITELTKFGPLHHPAELAGIIGMKEKLLNVPQVAVFDTSFHQSIPEENYLYAVPYSWYKDYKVRKYGFHGTSYEYILQMLKDYYVKDNINSIICHIGSGASISCIKDGQCYDTSMGLTPLDGIIMGTRSGRIDPSIIEYICKELEISVEEVLYALNRKSGLYGIAGVNDFRDIENLANNGNKNAKLAIKMFEDSIVSYIANYYFKLNGKLDALVFTAGIGENSSTFRKRIVEAISKPMNIYLNEENNNSIASFKKEKSGIISTLGSKHDVLVIPTDEEYIILKNTYETIKKSKEKKLILKK